MASSEEYLGYVLDQLSGLEGIRYRAMMDEYIIYYRDKVIGGVYDDRFLLKSTKSVAKMLPDAEYELPYEGAKDMILVDCDDREKLQGLVEAMYAELPATKRK